MGSGKTSWAIEYINQHTDENILYVTPYLDETERIQEKVRRPICLPRKIGNSTKLENIGELLSYGRDIASTHQLFKHFNDACREALKENKYTLFLDEAIVPVTQFQLKHKDDMLYLQQNKNVEIDNETGQVYWIGGAEGLDTRYNDIFQLAQDGRLFRIDDSFYVWQYPPEIFSLFDKVYVMTYLFDGTVLKYYFDLYHIQYQRASIMRGIDGYMLTDYYKPDKSAIWQLLHVYLDDDLNNNFKQTEYSFSASWFQNYTRNKQAIEQMPKNLQTLFRRRYNARIEEIMWTTFIKAGNAKSRLKRKGYTSGFVAYTERATNKYANRKYLAYCVNVFFHPEIKKFFAIRGIKVDEDMYALSEMLQWIWRSAIRNREDSYIYIPSKRMRNLLLAWLEN
ncbi:MAG: hypothetical protein ACI4PM_01990 [Butyricicoccus sp.]